MLNKTKRVLALLLAVVMVFALVGCSKVEDEGSSVLVEYVTDYEYVEGESSGDGDAQQSGQTQQPGQTPTKEDPKFKDEKIMVNPEDYRGTKIIFASTVHPEDDGTDYVIKNFEKKYGIEVEIMVPSLSNYNSEMAALIATNKAPTVGRSNGDAPIYVGYFQSLDATKMNYKHEIWNQNTFKRSTYNGSPYLCDTVGCYWTEIDIVVYSKSLLKKANCPTPEELDKQGKWNFDSYIMIGEKTSKLDGCNGATYERRDALLHMAGGALYRPDADNRMVSGVDDKTTKVFQKVAQGIKDGALFPEPKKGPVNLKDNTASISTAHAWNLRKDGSLSDHPNWNDIGFYYLPAFEQGGKPAVTGIFRGFGIMKGCNENKATGPKSAVAGGLFLSEYLDVGNYDLDNAFISEEAKTFFFKVCSLYAETDNYNPYYTYENLNEGISGIDDDGEVYSVMALDPSQVPTRMQAVKPVVDKGVKNLNDYIEKQINAH